MDTLIVIIYLLIGILIQIRQYKKDEAFKKCYHYTRYTSLFERMIYVLCWPFVVLANIEL